MSLELVLICQNYPSDRQTKFARKFGEVFTWTCSACKDQLVLTQGKGDFWYWQSVVE